MRNATEPRSVARNGNEATACYPVVPVLPRYECYSRYTPSYYNIITADIPVVELCQQYCSWYNSIMAAAVASLQAMQHQYSCCSNIAAIVAATQPL